VQEQEKPRLNEPGSCSLLLQPAPAACSCRLLPAPEAGTHLATNSQRSCICFE
jgi:hypothetical protein